MMEIWKNSFIENICVSIFYVCAIPAIIKSVQFYATQIKAAEGEDHEEKQSELRAE